jgi:hypothetical protein
MAMATEERAGTGEGIGLRGANKVLNGMPLMEGWVVTITSFQMQGHHSCLCSLPINISTEPGSCGVQAIKYVHLHHLSHANLSLTLLGHTSHLVQGNKRTLSNRVETNLGVGAE